VSRTSKQTFLLSSCAAPATLRLIFTFKCNAQYLAVQLLDQFLGLYEEILTKAAYVRKLNGHKWMHKANVNGNMVVIRCLFLKDMVIVRETETLKVEKRYTVMNKKDNFTWLLAGLPDTMLAWKQCEHEFGCETCGCSKQSRSLMRRRAMSSHSKTLHCLTNSTTQRFNMPSTAYKQKMLRRLIQRNACLKQSWQPSLVLVHC